MQMKGWSKWGTSRARVDDPARAMGSETAWNIIFFKFVAFWGLVTRRITVIKSAASVPGWNVYHLGCHDPAWSSGCFRNILFPTFDVFQSFLIIRLHLKHRYVTSSSENRSSFNSNNSLVYWRISSKQKSLSSPVNGLQKWFWSWFDLMKWWARNRRWKSGDTKDVVRNSYSVLINLRPCVSSNQKTLKSKVVERLKSYRTV